MSDGSNEAGEARMEQSGKGCPKICNLDQRFEVGGFIV